MATNVLQWDTSGRIWKFTGTVANSGTPVTVTTVPGRKFGVLFFTATDACFQVAIANGSFTVDSGTDNSVAFTAYCVEIFDAP